MSIQKISLFGYPLGHTMSPFIHKKLFELNNLKCEYEAIELKPENISDIRYLLKNKIIGCNLTIPHKSSVIPLLDSLNERAALYGAVNTVVNKNGVLTGCNTDCIGFLKALEHADIELKGRVLICGAGGASRMMAFESVSSGCEVTLAVRENGIKKARQVADEIKEKLGKTVKIAFYKDLKPEYDIILNGTPAGMYPNINDSPVNENIIRSASAVFDAVYNPEKTVFLKTAEKHGKHCGYGMVMLVYQAAAAQELWFNVKFSINDIDRIIREANDEMNRRFNKSKRDKAVVLCGFMGCGKSTVGKILAKKLNYDFIDADDYIEAKVNKKITDIFKENGEEYFRDLEHEVCAELAERKNIVIGSGGGALTFERNFNVFKNCRIVFLNVKTEILLKRLKNDKQPRPVLEKAIQTGNVLNLIEERSFLYKKAADIIVNVPTEQPPERIADLIKIKL